MCKWFKKKNENNKGYKPTVDIPSPRDITPHEDIFYNHVTKQIIIQNIDADIWLTEVEDTNSMDPTVDAGHTCIIDKSYPRSLLKPGDVVVYEALGKWIMHRIYEIGFDDDGKYFRLKGDNNYAVDPYKIRKEHIKGLLRGVIY